MEKSAQILYQYIIEFKTGSAQGEAFDYETAVQTCYLDGELVNRDPGILKLGQSYWVSGKRVELGCPRKGTIQHDSKRGRGGGQGNLGLAWKVKSPK